VSLKKSQGKAVEVTVNSKEENSEDFCLDFFQEFDLCLKVGKYILKSAAVYDKDKKKLPPPPDCTL
jgi:hypothetical protein